MSMASRNVGGLMNSVRNYQLANPIPPSSTNKSAQSPNNSISQQIKEGAKEASKHIAQIISQAPAAAKPTSKPEEKSKSAAGQPKKSAKLQAATVTTATTAFQLSTFNFTAPLPLPGTAHEQDKLTAKRHHPTSPPANLVALSNSNIIKSTQEDKEDVDMDHELSHTEGEKGDDDNNGYFVAGKKMKTSHTVTYAHTNVNTPKQTKSERLPAINLRIASYKENTTRFNNESVVNNSEELDRCFSPEKYKLDIKFMKFASYDARILVIATDDPDTHRLLSDLSKWPEDAFGRGVKPRHHRDPIAETTRVSTRKPIYSLSIKNVSQQIDVTSSVVKKALEQQGFIEARRTTNAKDDQPTSYVRLFTESKEVYDKHMYKGAPVTLYHHPHKVVIETRPLQCYNCQGLGHIAFNCPDDEPTCMQCKGKHRFRNCPEYNQETKTYSKTQCANCDSSEHNSCSRKCTKIREHVKAVSYTHLTLPTILRV